MGFAATSFFLPYMAYLTSVATNVKAFLTAADGTTLIDAITQGISTVLDWIGTVLTSLLSTSGELNPLLILFGIGIAISGILIAVRVIRSFIWGA